ncbi:hypothetical protein [Nonomuraea lactucae]|uniref:hypothetical protein n=1 Tax=Nonomuraea lactucae TaxID=2249762 RepID=UPI0013B475CE|nr:hypothetical protein [Nonomuraea lactucae]
MPSELFTAVIAGLVSLVVAVGTVTVSISTTRATLRRDRERQEAEFRRMMTNRLYDRRVAVYPALFAATAAFRRSKLASAPDVKAHLQSAVAAVDELHAGEVGLLLSPEGHEALLRLRKSVGTAITAESDDDLTAAIHDVWLCKNRLRASLRTDLGLLFDGEPASPPASSPA